MIVIVVVIAAAVGMLGGYGIGFISGRHRANMRWLDASTQAMQQFQSEDRKTALDGIVLNARVEGTMDVARRVMER